MVAASAGISLGSRIAEGDCDGTVVAVVVAVILGYGVGVFASSNIILPLLWAWPKARRLYREGMLTRPIPTWRFLIPFFVFV